jgi:hypothetical protein
LGGGSERFGRFLRFERFERFERFVKFKKFKKLEVFSTRERFKTLRWFKGLMVGICFA